MRSVYVEVSGVPSFGTVDVSPPCRVGIDSALNEQPGAKPKEWSQGTLRNASVEGRFQNDALAEQQLGRCKRRQQGVAGLSQASGLLNCGAEEYVGQGLFDEVLLEEGPFQLSCKPARERGLAAAWRSIDEDESWLVVQAGEAYLVEGRAENGWLR